MARSNASSPSELTNKYFELLSGSRVPNWHRENQNSCQFGTTDRNFSLIRLPFLSPHEFLYWPPRTYPRLISRDRLGLPAVRPVTAQSTRTISSKRNTSLRFWHVSCLYLSMNSTLTKPTESAEIITRSTFMVCVVDDEPAMVEMLVASLRSLGYDAVGTTTRWKRLLT